jgi:hypothetical protein
VIGSSTASNSLTGDAKDNSLTGGTAKDKLLGKGGADKLYANNGDPGDRVDGGADGEGNQCFVDPGDKMKHCT